MTNLIGTNLIGQRLGYYKITAMLGEGGIETVCRACQVRVRRDVTLLVSSRR